MSITVAASSVNGSETWLKPLEFSLPAGLIGFPEAQRLELIFNPDELPFMWLRAVEQRALNFIVVEPQGVLADYTIELGDEDAALLGLRSATDALLFNVVTFRADAPEQATVNLIGPVVVNRRTLVGRQVVIANYADYSARHPLLTPEYAAAAGR